MLLSNLADLRKLAEPGACEQHVDLSLLLPHRLIKPVQIRKVRSIALHTRHIPANRLHRLIQLVLSPASDEHVRAFFHEQLCRRKRHA